jgi:hypothetical protein
MSRSGAVVSPSKLLVCLLAAVALCVCHAASDQPSSEYRAIKKLTLANGSTFYLRLPRLLTNPEATYKKSGRFVRTFNDTCGLYSVIMNIGKCMSQVPDGQSLT